MRLLEDGTVLLNTGAVDIGQGSNTVLTQICAEALAGAADRIGIASPDTDGSPYNWGTTASRVTYMTGRVGGRRRRRGRDAAQAPCQRDARMRRRRSRTAAGRPGRHQGRAERELSFAAISGRAHWAAGGPIIGSHSWVFDQKTVDPKRAVAIGLPFSQIGVFSFAALVVEVEVDTLTGKVRVPRAWSACDVGRAINPGMVDGQIEGAFVQGLGFALTEEMVWDGARLANPSLMDYKIPTFAELPDELHAIIVESHEPSGPFGAKSVGEIGMNAVAAAIANAVADALGMRMEQLPLTSERVLQAWLASGARHEPAALPCHRSRCRRWVPAMRSGCCRSGRGCTASKSTMAATRTRP